MAAVAQQDARSQEEADPGLEVSQGLRRDGPPPAAHDSFYSPAIGHAL